jgi:signal peptidase I
MMESETGKPVEPQQPGILNLEQPTPQSAKKSLLRTWVRDLAISVIISAFFIIFLYQPVKVEGTSMLPGLEDQERIFINKFVYAWEPISRSDIIVFRYPRDPSKSYIKRVIAVGGDHVVIDKGRVYVNGNLLREPYVPAQFLDFRSYPETIVPENSYFVLGDHRSMSNDSRDFGVVDRSYVSGKAVFIYWPMAKLGMLR